jgi:hypothetical protein
MSWKERSTSLAVTLDKLDIGPDDLEAQLPVRARLLRRLVGPDAGDYTLAELVTPLSWKVKGTVRSVRYLVVGPHLLGQRLERGARDIGLNIAYVTDERVLDEPKFDPSKAEFVAVALASVE